MEKRLQLLLDAHRYQLISDEAQRSGRSVAAVIREAIDERFADHDADARRADAARLFLEMTADPGEGREADWVDIKADLEHDLTRSIERSVGHP